ncbi:MAG: choice-of-anchor J domain-containing protein, partial [bacterium]|nr:choice-of-anchor J domain-containing protein [bacterium]
MKKIALLCMMLATLSLAYAGQVVIGELGAKQAAHDAAKTEAVKVVPVEPVALPVVDKEMADIEALKAAEPMQLRTDVNGALDDCSTPFPEGCETVTPPTLPDCWVQENLNADGITWVSATSSPYTGLHSFRIGYNGSLAMDDWLISPGFVTTGGTYNLKFWYVSGGYDETMGVYYGTSQESAAMTNVLAAPFTFSGTTHVQAILPVTLAAGTDFFGWHGTTEADMYYMAIDDIELANANATGRCCYGTVCHPTCESGKTVAECAALSGVWTEGADCEGTDPCGAPPADYDYCCNAYEITALPFMHQFDNTGYTTQVLPSCGAGGTMGKEVWYAVVGDGTTYTASTCNAYTAFDTELQVWEGDCDNLVCVGGNDDDYTNCPDYGSRSILSWCALPGVTYYILVGSYSSSAPAGLYQVDVTSDGADCLNPDGRCCYLDAEHPDPENPLCAVNKLADCDLLGGDWTVGEVCLGEPPYGCPIPFHGENCSDPVATITTLPYTNSGTSGLVDDYNSTTATCIGVNYDNGYDVIYKLIVDVDKCIIISATQGSYQYVSVSLWNDCPDVGVCLAGAQASSGEFSTLCTPVTAGTYYIMIDNWPTPNEFTYTLTVDECECPAECTEWVNCGTPGETEPNDVCLTEMDEHVFGCDDLGYGMICPADESDYYLVTIPPMSYFSMTFY